MIYKQKINSTDAILLACNVTCLAYLFILGYYNRPTIDDFEYMSGQRGLLNSVSFFYHHVNGRFLPNFITSIIFIIYHYVQSLLFVPVVIIAGFYWIINKIITKRSMLFYFNPDAQLKKINFILFFICTLIIYNFEMNTFTWTIACIIYFGSIFFALVLFYSLTDTFNSAKKSVAIIFSSLFIGCANESFALNINLLLIIILVLTYLKNKRNDLQNIIAIKKIIMAIVFISISFLILYLSPGTDIKIANNQPGGSLKLPLPLSEILPATLHSYILLWKYILFKLPFLLLALIIFSNFNQFIKFQSCFKITIKNILLFLFSLWLLMLPTTYAINYTPFRVLTPVWLLLILFSIALASKLKFGKLITFASILIFFASIIYKMTIEIKPVRKYTAAYDARMKILKEHIPASQSETLVLDSLPDINFYRYSGLFLKAINPYVQWSRTAYYLQKIPFDNPFVYSPYRDAEISKEPDSWKNHQLKNALQLKFDIAVK